MIENEIIFFSSFTVFILGMLLLDLGVFSKKNHIISFKEAAFWSALWVALAIGFYFFLIFKGEWIHGIYQMSDLQSVVEAYSEDFVINSKESFETNLIHYKRSIALEFITGYLLEYSLSADNIFVIIVIFSSFSVREKYYKKVLFWGILGALIMRFIFIFVGATLIHHFHQVMYFFGALLVATGIKMFANRNKEDKSIEPNKHPIVKFATRFFSVYPRYVNDRFFVRKNKKWMITPLFLVLLIIEFTDLLFAVDSVPAIFSITKDPYVVFFSNIFAILGLRSMFFFLSNILHLFHYLEIGLAFLLTFIGLKMIFGDQLKALGFSTSHSIYVILGILVISIGASLLFPPKKEVVKNSE